PFAQYDVMRQRPAIQPNPLDTVVPTALRVGGAVAGSALGGALAGPPGAVAGGAVGSGLFELVAEAYEKSRGLRDEINPSQVATQAALGAIPIAGRTGSVAATAARRAGQGFVLGAGGDTMTRLAEGEDPSLAGMLVSGGLGAAMGGGAGAAEARHALRAAEQ